MGEFRGTPGPWTARDESGVFLTDHAWHADNDDSNSTESAPIHADGKVVALVVSTEWDSDELLANAALIAAAPELLEALQLCYDHCRLYHSEVERNNVGKVVRAAIAKATGA